MSSSTLLRQHNDKEERSQNSDEEGENEIFGGFAEDGSDITEKICTALQKNEEQRDEKYKEEAESLMRVYEGGLTTKRQRLSVYNYLSCNELFYFDIHEIRNDATIALFGRRRTGKSFLTRWILYNKRKVFPFGMVMTETKFNLFWEKYVNKNSIYSGYDPEVLVRLMKRQGALVKTKKHGQDPRVFVILDDVAGSGSLSHDPTLKKLFYNGRHYKCFIVVTSQWFKALAPGCRENAEYIFLFGMNNLEEMEAIRKEYAGQIEPELFYRMLYRYASASSCFVIKAEGKTPYERFFQYRAQDPGPFRLGCEEMWEGSNDDWVLRTLV